HDFTRRTLLQGGTALAATGALTGPALFDFAKAWAQSAPWKAEQGAKLTVMRWKRFVPAEDDAFNEMVAAFKAATGTEMNVFSESFEDVQPKASVAANTGSGLDLAWGLHTLPQLFPTKVLLMNDVADYLGKKYGGWTDAAPNTCKQGDEGEQRAGRFCPLPRHGRRQWLAALGLVGSRRLYRRQGRQSHHQLAGDSQGDGILQGTFRHLHSRCRILERLLQQQGVPVGRTLLHRSRHLDLRRRQG